MRPDGIHSGRIGLSVPDRCNNGFAIQQLAVLGTAGSTADSDSYRCIKNRIIAISQL